MERLPRDLFEEITGVRLRRPQTVSEQAGRRLRPEPLTKDGRLALLVADQPARQALASGGDPLALSDRYSFLSRIVFALTAGGLDGVAATTDVIDELLIVCHLLEERGHPRILDGKLLIASMNPGGAAGSVWEIDSRFTSFVPQTVAVLRLDGARLTLRLTASETRSADAVAACAAAITELNALGLTVFLDAAPVQKADGRWRTLREPADLVKLAGLASALGDSSLGLWLALPYCEGFAAVAAATTLPLFVSTGADVTDAGQCVEETQAAMRAGPNARGALLAASVLFLEGAADAVKAVARAVRPDR
ncbi:MAG: hypothetical protein QME71_08020 [Dehalococcoidia bacterium]|nr:hypothetical protein [Dehalococcoidia bacterium]